MIVVDSGVWIAYFKGRRTFSTDHLDELLGTEEVAVGDVIVAEVLRGFRSDSDFGVARDALTSLPVLPMLGVDRAVRSAVACRSLRERGVTVRRTIDVLVASYCADEQMPLLFDEPDLRPFVEHLGLVAA